MGTAALNTAAQGAVSGLGNYLNATRQSVLAGFSRHVVLYAIAMFTYGLGVIECMWLGLPVNFNLVEIISGTTVLFLSLTIAIWLMVEFVRLWWTGYKGSPSVALAHKLGTDIMAPSRVANTVHAIMVNGIFFVGFLAIKKCIPFVSGSFGWDKSLMEWDRILHFGTLPHEWLQPLMGSDLALFLININYNLWFVVILGCFFWFGFSKQDSFLRQRYITAYLIAWFIGTCVLGTLLASAGPCFYGFVEQGGNPYAGLMAKLQSANQVYPIWAVPTQDALWQAHTVGYGDVEGVSAMPSLHVGTAVLFVFLAFGWGKRWFINFTIPFCIAIFLGSIMLGWHYAIDGYAGGLIAWASWWIAGKLHHKRFAGASV